MRETEYGRSYAYVRKNGMGLCTDIGEIKRYMGCRKNEMPFGDVTALAERAAEIVEAAAQPKGCFMVCTAETGENGVDVGGISFLSHDLAVHTAGCTSAALAAVTLGAAVDREIAKASARDIALAYALDCAACAAVERFADEMCMYIAGNMKNCALTERFSPGYGDLSLEYQPLTVKLLDAGKLIGVGVNESLLLSPSKSVTAIIGIR